MACNKPLAKGQYWHFCGETDMGQSSPILCTHCGGVYVRTEDQIAEKQRTETKEVYGLFVDNPSKEDNFELMFTLEKVK